MKLTTAIREAFVRAVMQDVPFTDYKEEIRVFVQAMAATKLPPKIKEIYDDLQLRGYLNTERVYIGGGYIQYYGTEDLVLSPDLQEVVNKLEVLKDEQDAKHHALRTKLTAVSRSAKTRQQLINMLPEFEKYLPADEAAADRTVPCVANVVSEFMQAGWPK